ncbi:MAG: lipocalin-like domain-containing protein, partial [Chthoniobacteraceae bacterium]
MRPLPFLALALASALAAEPNKTPDGYALPQAGRQFVFPRDHGSHPEFKIEWWYLTGHLHADNGRRFGLQATFFRRADGTASKGNIYRAHMALLDVKTGRFIH